MEKRIYIGEVWGEHRNDRLGVIVEIRNRNHLFKFMPTYQDINKIRALLKEVEELNKNKCIKPFNIPESYNLHC